MSARKARGFTLIELMVVLAIAAIMMAFAIPAFQDVMSRSRMNSVAEELANSLAMARNTAVTRRSDVVFVPATGNVSPSWTLRLGTAAGPILAEHNFEGTIRLTFFNNASPAVASNMTEVTFQPSGYVRESKPENEALELNIRVCDSSTPTDLGRNIYVSKSGRIRQTANPTSATCNPS